MHLVGRFESLFLHSYAKLQSSSCSVFSTCVDEFGMTIAEYASPVIAKHLSSTPVARMPTATGKVEACEVIVIL